MKAEPSYSACKLWIYALTISLGSFQFGEIPLN